MRVKCQSCEHEFEVDLSDYEKDQVFRFITEDKELMYKLGQEAAKQLLDREANNA